MSGCKYLRKIGLIAIFFLLAACDRKENTEAPSTTVQAAAPSAPIDPSTSATIRGTVKLEGPAPKPFPIDMTQDPACKGTNAGENVVVEKGGLANVFVYVREGLGARSFDVPKEPVLIVQSGCKYHPHVVGAVVGQTVQIKNEDLTNHNLHLMPKENREWNESQPPSAPPIEKKFSREEIMMPMKCNQHPWMKMYLNVVNNPFFAVTDRGGNYEIKGLPPGDYTLAFVQEKLGERDLKFTLGPKEIKTLDQSFKAE